MSQSQVTAIQSLHEQSLETIQGHCKHVLCSCDCLQRSQHCLLIVGDSGDAAHLFPSLLVHTVHLNFIASPALVFSNGRVIVQTCPTLASSLRL